MINTNYPYEWKGAEVYINQCNNLDLGHALRMQSVKGMQGLGVALKHMGVLGASIPQYSHVEFSSSQWGRRNLEFYYSSKTLIYNKHKHRTVARPLY